MALPEASSVHGAIHAHGVTIALAPERPDGPNSVFESLHLFTDGALARGEVDEGVPNSLQRQHAAAGNAELEIDAALRSEAVKAINGAWNPGDQDGESEDEACTEIGHLDGIQSLQLRGSTRLDILQPRNDGRYHVESLSRSGCMRAPRQSLRIRSIIRSCLGCRPRLAIGAGGRIVQIGAVRIDSRGCHGESQVIIVLGSARSDLDFSGRSAIIIMSPREALRNVSGCCDRLLKQSDKSLPRRQNHRHHWLRQSWPVCFWAG